jgi:phage gp29-like protein
MKEEQIEKLLEKWGAKKELNHKKHTLPALVSIGYKIGQQWASNQKREDLLSRFEEFYKDWANDQLTNQRYKILYQELAPASIIAEMSDMLSQALVDPHVAAAMLENFHLFENGIVWGLMSAIRDELRASPQLDSGPEARNPIFQHSNCERSEPT